MKKDKNIINQDSNGDYHGYQAFYQGDDPYFMGYYKHGELIGYSIYNPTTGYIGQKGTQVEFHIK